MPRSLRLPVFLLALIAPLAFGQQNQITIDGRTSSVMVFPEHGLLVTVEGEEEARVGARFGADTGPELYPGDLVVVFNDTTVANGPDFKARYDALAVGETVALSVERDGTLHDVTFPKPDRPSGQVSIQGTADQAARARAAQGWTGTALATAEEAAAWVPTGGATAEHDPVNGSVRFAGEQGGTLRFAPDDPLDLSRKATLRLRFKGDGGTYALRLTDAAGQTAALPFDTDSRWTLRDLDLGDATLDRQAITTLEIVPDGVSFYLELDAVELR